MLQKCFFLDRQRIIFLKLVFDKIKSFHNRVIRVFLLKKSLLFYLSNLLNCYQKGSLSSLKNTCKIMLSF